MDEDKEEEDKKECSSCGHVHKEEDGTCKCGCEVK